jgi:hypothetical protein
MTEKKPNSIERRRVTLQETDRQARSIIHTDQESTRDKTKRLKAQRLAKEAHGKRGIRLRGITTVARPR